MPENELAWLVLVEPYHHLTSAPCVLLWWFGYDSALPYLDVLHGELLL